MVAFEINVADVIARRGYPMLSQRGAPAFLAWVGAPGEIQGSRQVAIGQQVRQLRARVIPAAFPSGKPCHFWKGVNGKLKRGGRRRGLRDHRKPTATTNLGNLGIPSGRGPH